MNRTALIFFMGIMALLANCRAPDIRARLFAGEERVRIAGPGAYGIFDPSFAPEPGGGIWMSLSSVDPSYHWPVKHPHTVSTALAFSGDGGGNWKYIARLNRAPDVLHGKDFAGLDESTAFNWSHEVSTLVHDPRGPAKSRWRIFWHRYAHIAGKRRFEYGWIAHKAAANPRDLVRARETKLFTARGYNKAADKLGGAPRVKLRELTSAPRDCIVLTEPSALVHEDTLYLSLFCATGRAAGRIILLAEREGQWTFAGTFLENRAEAATLSKEYPAFDGFSAPELARKGNKFYLLITPTRPGSHPGYRGCMVMEIANLKKAELRRRGAAPEVTRFISAGRGLHRGACAYNERVSGGIYLSRAYPRAARVFRVFRTGVEP